MQELISMLKAPGDDIGRLTSIVPDELRRNWLYRTELSRFMEKLFSRPGFLYDRLWTATLLGIREESFSKVEYLFRDAKFVGVFAEEDRERWWQSKLKEILFCQFPDSNEIFTWKLGRKLPGINEDDFSKCYVSGEDFPETVAFTDKAAKTREPMRIRYTVSHPGFEQSLFFEEMRMEAK